MFPNSPSGRKRLFLGKLEGIHEWLNACLIALEGNKSQKGVTQGRDKKVCDKNDRVKFAPAVFVAPQIDYTNGTCNRCYAKRENVSLAHEDCECTVSFQLDKAFKVTL